MLNDSGQRLGTGTRINQDQKDEVETLIAMFSEEKWWVTVGKGLHLISSCLGFALDANVIEKQSQNNRDDLFESFGEVWTTKPMPSETKLLGEAATVAGVGHFQTYISSTLVHQAAGGWWSKYCTTFSVSTFVLRMRPTYFWVDGKIGGLRACRLTGVYPIYIFLPR